MTPLHLVMPMAGRGSRFAREGFNVPKPLVPLHGKPFFVWAVESVTSKVAIGHLVFVVLREHVEHFAIDREIRARYPEAHVVAIDEVTAGAAETAAIGIATLPPGEAFTVNDCDHAFDATGLGGLLPALAADGGTGAALLGFAATSPGFSYVRFDAAGRVDGTVEKQVVSRFAIAGCYLFGARATFETAMARYRGTCAYDELFMSGVYNTLLESGGAVAFHELRRHLPFGTPPEMKRVDAGALVDAVRAGAPDMAASIPLFLLAVGLLFSAHVLRSHRQTLLFPDHVVPWRFDLLLGLALSHLVNVLLPWRSGDVVRIGYVAMRYRLRSSYVAATVVTERLSDIGVVLLLSGWLLRDHWGPGPALLRLVELLALLGATLLGVAWSIRRSRRVRRWTWTLLSVLSDRLRLWVADLLWSFSQLVTGRSVLRPEFLLLTAIMWVLYLGSYAVFAAASRTTLAEVGMVLLGGPTHSLLRQLLDSGIGPQAALLFLFSALPVAAVLGYGVLRHNGQFMRQVNLMRRYGFQSLAISQPIAGDRFASRDDYGAFLRAHFTGANAIVSKFGLIASSDVKVLRLLPGGSDAVTAMIETGGVIRIRKCATEGAAAKLAEQAAWLREQAGSLPLTRIDNESRSTAAFTYDMPYLLSARDFYEVIHTSPVAHSARILTEVVDAVGAFHQSSRNRSTDPALVDKYLQDKVCANAAQVHAFAAVAFPDGEYRVNGILHRLDEWRVLFDLDWLRAQVKSRDTAVIHGDLTIENIIVSSEVPGGWYLIDPNPSNVFNTPLIDWAKLMQSLHLGYEGLNRGGRSVVKGHEIELMFLRSSAYSALHAHLSHDLERRLGAGAMREIAFHELVNYLRLTPYKIRHAPEKALTFFACTSVLLRRYLEPDTSDHQPVRSVIAGGAPGFGAMPSQVLQ